MSNSLLMFLIAKKHVGKEQKLRKINSFSPNKAFYTIKGKPQKSGVHPLVQLRIQTPQEWALSEQHKNEKGR